MTQEQYIKKFVELLPHSLPKLPEVIKIIEAAEKKIIENLSRLNPSKFPDTNVT